MLGVVAGAGIAVAFEGLIGPWLLGFGAAGALIGAIDGRTALEWVIEFVNPWW